MGQHLIIINIFPYQCTVGSCTWFRSKYGNIGGIQAQSHVSGYKCQSKTEINIGVKQSQSSFFKFPCLCLLLQNHFMTSHVELLRIKITFM